MSPLRDISLPLFWQDKKLLFHKKCPSEPIREKAPLMGSKLWKFLEHMLYLFNALLRLSSLGRIRSFYKFLLHNFKKTHFISFLRDPPSDWIWTLFLHKLPSNLHKIPFPPIFIINLSQVFMVRPDVKQDYTLYGAVPATVTLRRIKVTRGTPGSSFEQEASKSWLVARWKVGG